MTNLFQQLNPQQSNLASLFKNTTNPQQLLMNMAQNNPQIRQTLDMIRMSNKSPKDLFYEMVNKQGVNPNDILNMLK